MGNFKELIAYQRALSGSYGNISYNQDVSAEEKYSLTDQIRRSSRSVCTNMAEAYKRRRYKDYFVSQLNDCETENTETQVWMDFALDCKYLDDENFKRLTNLNNETGKLIWYMINNPDKFM